MPYINRKGDGYLETVDEADTYKEARYLLQEYQRADRYGHYYISQRSTKDWRNR